MVNESNIIAIVSVGSLIIFSAYQFLYPKLKNRRQEYDAAGMELIQLLEATKKELLNENQKLRAEFNGLKQDFDKLSAEYRLLKDIFQGRDEETIKFRQRGMEAFDQMRATNDLTVVTHAKVLESLQLQKKILEKV